MDPSRKSITSTFNFPIDLLYLVLPRLPVKTVTRFKLVSKGWHNVIEKEDFFRTVYNNRPIADDQLMIINYRDLSEKHSSWGPQGNSSFGLLNVSSDVANVGLPFSAGDFSWRPNVQLIGSDLGLVCVAVPLSRQNFPEDYPLVKQQIQIYLWNPATKQSKTIPLPPPIDMNVCTFGFGYDSIENVFKVVCVEKSQVTVYSTGENLDVWRKLDLNDSVYQLPVRLSFDLCLHGFLLGIGRDGMLCFAINSEVYTSKLRLPVLDLTTEPPSRRSTLMNYGHLVGYNDCVAYSLAYRGTVYLWSLDDEACFLAGNVESSWTLTTCIVLDGPAAQFPRPNALRLFNDQQILIANCLFEVYFQKIRHVKRTKRGKARFVPFDFKLAQAFKYRESMAFLPGFRMIKRSVRVAMPRRRNSDPLMWYIDDKHFLGDFSFATLQANTIMEDYSQVYTMTNATFVGVYDGHGGSAASRYIRDHLFDNLMTLVKENGKMSGDKLKQAFAKTEAGFLSFVEATSKDDPLIAAVGSCCLVGVIWERNLFIANLGDSRATVGRVLDDQVGAAPLTHDHNANVAEAREKLMSAHPSDPKVVFRDKKDKWRVKGTIQVTRTIGDAYLKKAGFAPDPRSRVQLKEALQQPVLSADPQIYTRKLRAGDKFLVFASDGLWKRMTNEEAVEIVNNNPRPDIAKRLIERALGYDSDRLTDTLPLWYKFEEGTRRTLHDDITVVVIFLDNEWPKKNDVQEKSVLGGAVLYHL